VVGDSRNALREITRTGDRENSAKPGNIRRMKDIQMPADNCPEAPQSQVTVYTRVLHRACQIEGGVEKLAARLRVPVATLYRWLDGEAEPPTPVFLKAVDIVMPAWSTDDELLAQALRSARPKKPLA
jgi:hypothetical protein